MKTTLLVLISFLLIKADRNINSRFFIHEKNVEITSAKAVIPTSFDFGFTLDVATHTLYVRWNPTGGGSVVQPVRWLEDQNQVRYVLIQGPHTETYYGAIIQPNVTQHYYIGNQMATFKWDGVNPECIIICQPGPNTSPCPF